VARVLFWVVIAGFALASCGGNAGYQPGDPKTSYWYLVTDGKAMPRRKPGASEIIVKKGDTLYSLAREHDVDLQSLIDANGFEEPYALSEGQKVRIPAVRTHKVVAGDTLYSLSKRYEVDLLSLALMNTIEPPFTLSIDQVLRIPGHDEGSPTQEVWDPFDEPEEATTIAQEEIAAPEAVSTTTQSPKKAGKPTNRFLWPVTGKVISQYGAKQGGLYNDGINVAAPDGSPIFATDDGLVTYVGNELRGYGNLVLVRHEDNWISAYSHTARYRVTKGQRVVRGQHIADVGQTGNVNTAQLHFELRRGTKSVDPIDHLSVD
jgi:murein DD-endopeptidase MepM/ murein hydrolase activator NlpD